ncbi:aminotransferase class V-fold PLP-dependent enzyme [Polynucleobacter victoriensis]|uniref:Aspartate aminotransferase n=1 Tax=Polynucleobacter victoriensis TaxID=2049319 RepID=A0A212U1R9_9BURK|nr:aminotransferase class V-fold PLP-dependent enzyme [Polynucleobacter victoriensis]SNC72189.1 aspartate aminotransferase [Polynucleobacter victoriensis]
MPGLLPNVDPDGLLEFSVVYTDRSLNHMSNEFKRVITDISSVLKDVYQAHSTVVIPGSGTYGMEAVARQFATNQKCLVIRNGWFSYRWTQIFEAGQISQDLHVIKARRSSDSATAPFAPAPIDEIVNFIKTEKPAVVFAPHVETSAGMILPDDYLKKIGEAVRSVDGLFVLDCIASGAMWVNMRDCQVDVSISAPQKGWSSSPCCALIGLSDRARTKIDSTTSTSFSCDLKKWLQIMETYESGNHVYHTTMPTDALKTLRNVMKETQSIGFEKLKAAQIDLGNKVRNLLVSRGFTSVAAPGFQSPCVVVSYTTDPEIQSGKKFINVGLQTAAGVPLQCDEGPEFRTFRLGLFGLEKLQNIDRTIKHLEHALNTMN